MAENTMNIGKEQGGATFKEEVYELLWTIADWKRIEQRQETVEAQTFEFSIGKSVRSQTKWKMGFKIIDPEDGVFNPFWKLIEANGFPDQKIEATTVWTLLNADLTDEITEIKKGVVRVGRKVRVPTELYSGVGLEYWGVNINLKGELVCKLQLTIMEPVLPSVKFRMERFHKACVAPFSGNFAGLLGDKSTTDLKIMTNDGKQLFAHKIILQAQCPVFESIFRSGLSEMTTGIVNVTDVNAKTMGILLHFFYSGELLPSWKDNDTVVEFTYAVGKYQLTNILTMLDDVLGSRDEDAATYTDVQLLDLAEKLELKTAGQELMERIRKTLCKVKTESEFLTLWGIEMK